MRYVLAVLTHGRAPHLNETIKTFLRWATPQPTALLAVVDGADSTVPAIPSRGTRGWHVHQNVIQEGFCGASARLWEAARQTVHDEGLTHVFWLENDFRFLRPVQLDLMANVLRQHPVVAQMALMRQPVNAAEVKAGSVLASRPDQFWHRQGWMEHTSFWTTNPSLIPAGVLYGYDWPDDGQGQCEGRFGLRLKADARTFGYWGNGDTWVEHLGTRDGTGKGY
jgi:hypothetical protein